MAELLGGANPVTVSTKAADVGVIVAAILAQRDDVVGHRGCPDEALGSTVPAEWLGP